MSMISYSMRLDELTDMLDSAVNALSFASDDAREMGLDKMASCLNKMGNAVYTMMRDIEGVSYRE